MVEFVDYNGCYPNACSGTLTLLVNGEKVVLHHALCSGGSVWFDDDWCEHIEDGPWSVDVPKELEKYSAEITEVVNENVSWGCCGGCV